MKCVPSQSKIGDDEDSDECNGDVKGTTGELLENNGPDKFRGWIYLRY